jgi:hypothetical protein
MTVNCAVREMCRFSILTSLTMMDLMMVLPWAAKLVRVIESFQCEGWGLLLAKGKGVDHVIVSTMFSWDLFGIRK